MILERHLKENERTHILPKLGMKLGLLPILQILKGSEEDIYLYFYPLNLKNHFNVTLLKKYNLPNPTEETENQNCSVLTLQVESGMINNIFMMKPLLMEVHGFTGKIFQIFINSGNHETLYGI